MSNAPQFPDPLGVREVYRPGATAHKAGPDIVRRVQNLEQGAAGRPGPGVSNGSVLTSDTTQTGGVRWENRSIVSSLPGSPVDGQECYYQDSAMETAGIVWHFKYDNSQTTYKWMFVGGIALQHDGATGVNINSATYTTFASPATLTLPFAGVWEVEAFLEVTMGFATAATGFMSYAVGATAASNEWAAIACTPGSSHMGNGIRTYRHTIASASTAITARGSSVGTNGADFYRTRLRATPVRVA